MNSSSSNSENASSLTDVQLEIMTIVWDHGEITVYEVHAILAERRPVARNTIQTMMSRLAERGWLIQRKVGNRHCYSPARSRHDTLGRLVKRLVDTAFHGSADGLVSALLDQHGLTSDEVARIRDMIDQAEQTKRKRKR